MYRVIAASGDNVSVPRLIFQKLTTPCNGDARFKVALFLVASSEADAKTVSEALHLPLAEAERALQYWEGAGLLERLATEQATPYKPAARKRMTTREVTAAGEEDAMLGGMIGEIQRIFGGVVSQSDINVFVTLYKTDGVPADLILLAASHFASRGKASARYIEKTLLSWRRDGICDCTSADLYLKQLAQREVREGEVGELMGKKADGYTVAEKKRIAKWFEEYGYSLEMVRSARLVAGEKQDDVRYLDGILKNWFGKGYTTPRDVQAAEEGRNLRVQADRGAVAPEDDLLMNTTYVPMKGRRAQ